LERHHVAIFGTMPVKMQLIINSKGQLINHSAFNRILINLSKMANNLETAKGEDLDKLAFNWYNKSR